MKKFLSVILAVAMILSLACVSFAAGEADDSFFGKMSGALMGFVNDSGFANLSWQQVVMLLVSFVLMYLAIVKQFEPLLLLPIAFGMFLANFPLGGINDVPSSTIRMLSPDLLKYAVETAVEGAKGVTLASLQAAGAAIAEGTTKLTSDQLLALTNYMTTATYAQVLETAAASATGEVQTTLKAILDAFAADSTYNPVADAAQYEALKSVFGYAAGDFSNLSNTLLASGEHLAQEINELHAVQLVGEKTNYGGLIYYLSRGVKFGIYPPLIFMGVGAMTDFGPLLANPTSILLGGAAQIGIFGAYLGAVLLGFTPAEAGSIGIIGGADGPTALYLTSKLADHLLGPIAVAAYSYMALVPVIQPPIMKALTTKEERMIKMSQLRPVSKTEKVIFPVMVTALVGLILPSTVPLLGMLMLGNLCKEAGVVDRISKTAQNELMNIVTIFLGISVGSTATAEAFLNMKTIGIMIMGVVAFGCGTAGGVLLAKLMNVFRPADNKINPLIGSAGVSAVPMAARVSQVVGQKANPSNFLLMHAMGPNVAGVIGSAIAAGMLLSYLG